MTLAPVGAAIRDGVDSARTPLRAEPMLRKDLVVTRLETPEGPRFVFKDSRTKRYYRLREVEYSIVRRLDGRTSLADIAAASAAEQDVDLGPGDVEAFVAQFQRQGLLDDPSTAPPPRERFVRGTPLYLRFRAFDPDRLLDWLITKVRFFFSPYFVVGTALLLVWAVGTVLTQSGAILHDLARLWSFQSLFLAWLVLLFVVALHEFAHGLTCKYFGGKVHEMGFLLIYLQPAFYCNVSDAWLFAEKYKRLWVTAAGPYFELFVWSLAVLLWTVVEPGTLPSGVALLVIATSAVKQFFNFNPLIKLDGYYFLSDVIDVPNLRARAFAYLRNRVKHLVGLVDPSLSIEASRRERFLFVAYGVLAFAFTYWFLANVLFRIGDYLTTRYQAAGFAAFTLFLGLVFPQPMRLLMKHRASVGSTVAYPPPPTPPAPRPTAAHSITGAQPAGRGRRVVFLVLMSAATVLLFAARVPLRVAGSFELLPTQNADVPATLEGVIERVYVEEGQVVRTGDTLARLSEREHRARLRAVEADVAAQRAQLNLLRAGPRREEVALAELAVARAEEPLRVVRAEADRITQLAAKQLAAPAEVERVEAQVGDHANELEQARGRLAMLRAGSRPESIAATEQAVARAVAERSRLESEIARLVLIAPHGGVVTTPRMSEKVGEYVKPGELIAQIYAVDHVTAVISVSERDVGEVRVGQPASLRLRAYPSRTFRGKVTRMAMAAMDTGWRAERTVRVEVDLTNAEQLLRAKMTGYARIDVGERRAVDVLTRRLRRYIRVEFWSWW
jgi:putative peptide zinc metalloprotease protein